MMSGQLNISDACFKLKYYSGILFENLFIQLAEMDELTVNIQ